MVNQSAANKTTPRLTIPRPILINQRVTLCFIVGSLSRHLRPGEHAFGVFGKKKTLGPVDGSVSRVRMIPASDSRAIFGARVLVRHDDVGGEG